MAVAVAGCLVALVSGCGGSGEETAADTGPPTEPQTYVAIGGGETVGLGATRPVVEAWPQLFYRTALEPNTVFVNLGVAGSTVSQALAEQLPVARELQPTLVTVWLSGNDLLAGVTVEAYEAQLSELVGALRQGRRARVLLANTPPVEQLPAYETFSSGRFASPDEAAALVAEYNQAIERVATAEGAEVVDLHAAGVEAVEDGTFGSQVSEDGFHPNTEGHAAVAEVFAAAL